MNEIVGHNKNDLCAWEEWIVQTVKKSQQISIIIFFVGLMYVINQPFVLQWYTLIEIMVVITLIFFSFTILLLVINRPLYLALVDADKKDPNRKKLLIYFFPLVVSFLMAVFVMPFLLIYNLHFPKQTYEVMQAKIEKISLMQNQVKLRVLNGKESLRLKVSPINLIEYGLHKTRDIPIIKGPVGLYHYPTNEKVQAKMYRKLIEGKHLKNLRYRHFAAAYGSNQCHLFAKQEHQIACQNNSKKSCRLLAYFHLCTENTDEAQNYFAKACHLSDSAACLYLATKHNGPFAIKHLSDKKNIFYAYYLLNSKNEKEYDLFVGEKCRSKNGLAFCLLRQIGHSVYSVEKY